MPPKPKAPPKRAHQSKGKIGGIGAVLTGAGMLAAGIAEGDHDLIGQGVLAIFAGLGIFGIRARQDD